MTLKSYHYFFNFKLTALKCILIRAMEAFYENSTVSKIFSHTIQNPHCRCRIELTWPAYHHKAVWWQIQGQKHRPLYPQCGAHSSQPQLLSPVFFKGSVCVNDQLNTTQAAVEPDPWLQVYFSPEQGVNDHIWEARGSPEMAWGNCPLLGYRGSSFTCASNGETEPPSNSLRFCEVEREHA